MARRRIHLSISINGLLRNYKGRKINCFSDHGRQVSDAEAREYLDECLAKGWTVIPCCAEEECPDFDHFGAGCPGHIIEEDEKGGEQ